MHFDLLVIGAGPGGYVAAIRAAQLGMSVAIIDRGAVGGTCLNCGCIPTKSLYESARLLREIRRAKEFGIETRDCKADLRGVLRRKDEVVNTLVNGVEQLLLANRVERITGIATLISHTQVRVTAQDGERVIEAKRILIATGSQTSIPPIPGAGLPGVETSREALDWQTLPARVVIIGGGVIGIELAGIFRAFGAEVSVVEALPNILPNLDREMGRRLGMQLGKQGISILTGTGVQCIEQSADGLIVTVEKGEKRSQIECDRVILSTGRRPVTNELGLETVGVSLGPRGGITVDEDYQTNVSGVYAIGDVTGRVMLAHVASQEGKAAVERMAGLPGEIDYGLIPSAVFSFPDLACVGLSEEEAKARQIPYVTGKFSFSGNGKALTMGEAEGLVKVLAAPDFSQILGVHIVGPHASDLIAEAVTAMAAGLSVERASAVMHGHPTLTEALEEALEAAMGGGIHSLPRKKLKQ